MESRYKIERSFISQYPPLSCMRKEETGGMWEKKDMNLYVHIPFCSKKCGFCYYKSYEIGDTAIPEEYIEALKKEIEIYSQMPEIQSRTLRTVYFGGGTPSLMSMEQIESLYTLITSRFRISETDFEFCSEARPGPSITLEKLRLLKSLGLRRLSLGCQSLDDDVLAVNKRTHKSQEFYKAYELARKAGIYSVNVDLMSGMVNQSMESFIDTIDTVTCLKPENITIYKMELFLNNELYADYRKGTINLMTDEMELEYAREGYKKLLGNGYQLREYLYFDLAPEYGHLQRKLFYEGVDLIGIGASSHAYFNGYIYQNEALLPAYYEKIAQGKLPIQRAHKLTAKEKYIRQAVMGIRGLYISRARYEEEFGFDIMSVLGEQLEELEKYGFIRIFPDHIETTVEGAIRADDIVREFFLPEHRNIMLAHIQRTVK